MSLVPQSLDAAFVGETASVDSPLGPLLIGVVDPFAPGVAEAISGLLTRSIQDAREETGGHLPSWLVDDIERNYISPAKIRSLWAETGHRFVVVYQGRIIGTIHVARDHETILTVDRNRINVPAADYPGFKPERHHHVVNISVLHELRRAGVGSAMVDGIVTRFRHLFDGDGLWVRADPPWHPGLVGLGFVHDPSLDVFLPASATRTANLPHAEFNRRYACDCVCPAPLHPDRLADRPRAMREEKLQYVSLARPFERAPSERRAPSAKTVALATDEVTLEKYARDWGRTCLASPRAIAHPDRPSAVADLLAYATRAARRVVVRGRGHSAEGQSLGDDIVLSTERLTRVGPIEGDSIRIDAGVTWDSLVPSLAARGAYPPVMTGWLPATVGGTLATGGFSKGSHRHGLVIDHVRSLLVATGDGRLVECSRKQAGWLYEAVLGGLGHFGVIVEATLELASAPPFVHVMRTSAGADPRVLLSTLDLATADETAVHVTSFIDRAGSWTVVKAQARTEPTPEPFASYVAPTRPAAPADQEVWLHVFVPRAGLVAYLREMLPRLRVAGGDAVQILPIRKVRARAASLVETPNGADGDVFFGVCLTRQVRDRARSELIGENRALLDHARGLGATSYFGGTLPQSESDWRRALGDRFEAVMRTKKWADPAGVLGALLS